MAEEEEEDKQQLAEERTERAEERTKWADHRTYLAKQRTLAAWLRTSLACIAVGLGVTEFITEVDPGWLVTILGVLFVATGGIILVLSYLSYRKVSLNLGSAESELGVSDKWILSISAGLFLCALVAVAVILVRGGM